MNTAEGMSGAPIFTPHDGKVIGLHYAGVQGTVGIAWPIDKKRVKGWLDFFDKAFLGQQDLHPLISPGGDILRKKK